MTPGTVFQIGRGAVAVDELLELADRIVVMFEGRLVHETLREAADVHVIGRHMASHP